MSIKICVYKGRTKACANPEDIPVLENIPELPWKHKSNYCQGSRVHMGSCTNQDWKTQPSFTQIVPSNSRPVPLRRNWHAPSRPMPSLGTDPSCNTVDPENRCGIDMNNTPLNDSPQQMNDEEYLSYNNPDELVGADGLMHKWFYNGPGWKISRVHGKSKARALPRPIKHWRKQLFPRQQLDVSTGQPYPSHQHLPGTSLDNTNGGRSGRLSVIDRPGGAITIDPSMIAQLYEEGALNTTSCIPIYFPTDQLQDSCKSLSEKLSGESSDCRIRHTALQNARGQTNVTFNRHSFSSTKMYLQSRAKLHYQQSTIQFNYKSTLPVLGWQGVCEEPQTLPPSSVSLYLRDISGNLNKQDCSGAVPVSFKPFNNTFATDSAVSSTTNIKRIRRAAITRNQYNVTNKWGAGYDTIKHWPLPEYRTKGNRRGSSALNNRCCLDPSFANWYPVPPAPKSPPLLSVTMKVTEWNKLQSAKLNPNAPSPDFKGGQEFKNIMLMMPISYTTLPNNSILISKHIFINQSDSERYWRWIIQYIDSGREDIPKSEGFTMYDAMTYISWLDPPTSTSAPLEYPLNIERWDGTPLVANNLTLSTNISPQFSLGSNKQDPSVTPPQWAPNPSHPVKWTGNISAPDLPVIKKNVSLSQAFMNVTSPKASFGSKTGGEFSSWDIKNVVSLEETFRGANNFNQNLSSWDTSIVTNMSGTFHDASGFNSELWNITNSVTNMSAMFQGAIQFNQPLANWITSKVIDMSGMFYDASGFNQPLNHNCLGIWDTSKVTSMRNMFHNDASFNQHISNWNTSSVRDMSGMFCCDTDLKYGKPTRPRGEFNNGLGFRTTPGLWTWNVAKVTTMQSMFSYTRFDQDISKWDITGLKSNTPAAAHMFDDCPLGISPYTNIIESWASQVDQANRPHDISLGAFHTFKDSLDPSGSKYFPWAKISHDFLTDTPIPGWDISDGGMFDHIFSFEVLTHQWKNIKDAVVSSGTQSDLSAADACPIIYPSAWNQATIKDKVKQIDSSIIGGNYTFVYVSDLSENTVVPYKDDYYGISMNQVINRISTIPIPTTGAPYPIDIQNWAKAPLANQFNGEGLQFSSTFSLINQKNLWMLNQYTLIGGQYPGQGMINAKDTPQIRQNTSLQNAFAYGKNLRKYSPNEEGIRNFGSWDVAGVVDMSGMFYECSNNNLDISGWDTSSVTSMASMFYNNHIFNDKLTTTNNFFGDYFGDSCIEDEDDSLDNDLSQTITYEWNTSKVTYMQYMFFNCYNFVADISTWNTHDVKYMNNMFQGANQFNINLNSWQTDKVVDMNGMFMGTSEFNNFTGSELDWNVQEVTNMTDMFHGATKFNCKLHNWQTDDLTYMESMFQGASKFNNGGGNTPLILDTSKVRDMKDVFNNAIGFNQDISTWNTTSVTDMTSMFFEAYKFNQNINYNQYHNYWDTHKVTSMIEMFSGANQFNNPLDGWNTSSVSYMTNMFHGASKFNQPITNWDTSNICDMDAMFYNATDFYQDCSWNIKAVTDISEMFKGSAMNQDGCGKYAASRTMAAFYDSRTDSTDGTTNQSDPSVANKLPVGWNTMNLGGNQVFGNGFNYVFFHDAKFNQALSTPSFIADYPPEYWCVSRLNNMTGGSTTLWANANVSNWDTGNVTDMSGLFMGANKFNQNLGCWDVGNVSNMQNMFYKASIYDNNGVQNLNNWNTHKVVDMHSMFNSASHFNIDIKDWNVAIVTDMRWMFASSIFNYSLNNWNTNKVRDMRWMFDNNKVFNKAFNTPGTKWTTASVTSMRQMFDGATVFNQDINDWDTSQVVDMSGMFMNAIAFNNFNKPSLNLDVSKVTNMRDMFHGAIKFSQGLQNWQSANLSYMEAMFMNATLFNNGVVHGDAELILDTSKVRDMRNVFNGANYFNQIIDWNTSIVTNMSSMFENAQSFNRDIHTSGHLWDTSKVGDMSDMFFGANQFNGNITNWNTGAVTTMSYMFNTANQFNKPITDWNVSRVTNMSYMFYNAKKFYQDLEWNIKNVSEVSYMFKGSGMNQDGCSTHAASRTMAAFYESKLGPNDGPTIQAGLPNGWDTMNLGGTITLPPTAPHGNGFSYVFFNDSKFIAALSSANPVPIYGETQYWCVSRLNNMTGGSNSKWDNTNISNWDTGNVTDMSKLFEGAATFNQNLSCWDVGNVSNMSQMFQNARLYDNAGNQNLKNWNTHQVTTMRSMFTNTIGVGTGHFNQPIGTWNVAIVTDMAWMFAGTQFNQNLSTWNTSKVGDMDWMFQNANQFNKPLSSSSTTNWTTESVTSMHQMFFGATTFNQDISDWDTSQVVDMSGMFMFASDFNNLNKPRLNWDVNKVTNMRSMFAHTKTFNQDIAANGIYWNTSTVRDMTAMFKHADKFNKDISNWNTSTVTRMYEMFNDANIFNQDLGNWNINQVEASSIPPFSHAYEGELLYAFLGSAMESSWPDSSKVWPNGITYIYGLCPPPPECGPFLYPATQHPMPPSGMKYRISGGKWDTFPLPNWLWADMMPRPINTDINASRSLAGWVHKLSGGKSRQPWAPPVGPNFPTEGGTSGPVGKTGLPTLLTGASYPDGLSAGDSGQDPVLFSYVYSSLYQYSFVFLDGDGWFQAAGHVDGAAAPPFYASKYWCVSGLKDMSYGFIQNIVFNDNISIWDTANVTNMQGLFSGCNKFNNGWTTGASDHFTWNTANVLDMSGMFLEASVFNQDISSWNTHNVTTMQNMFMKSGFDHSISTWNTHNVTTMNSMFYGANQFNNGWTTGGSDHFTLNTANVLDMSGMFLEASVFNQDISTWNTHNVTTMQNMFMKSGFDHSISTWNTHNVTTMNSMFYGANQFNEDISNWNTHNVLDMSEMFEDANQFNGDVSNWNIYQDNVNMNQMFYNAGSFNNDSPSNWQLPDAWASGDRYAKRPYINQMFTGSGVPGPSPHGGPTNKTIWDAWFTWYRHGLVSSYEINQYLVDGGLKNPY